MDKEVSQSYRKTNMMMTTMINNHPMGLLTNICAVLIIYLQQIFRQGTDLISLLILFLSRATSLKT